MPFLGQLSVIISPQILCTRYLMQPSNGLCFHSMLLSQAVFIDRKNFQDAKKTFSDAAATMKANRMSIFIFAEGTRSNKSEISLLPFKKGAFHLAVQGGFPIVPMICENYYDLYASRLKRFEAGELVVRGEQA